MNKELDLTRTVMIQGAENFAQWLTIKYNLPIKGIDKNITEWKEQLK